MPISDSTASVLDAEVSARVADVRERIAAAAARGGHGQSVTVIAVTKTHGPEAVLAAHQAGVGDVGENRVQEAEAKMAQVHVPMRWHLIGHLQRNKARTATRFQLVHGVDSQRLAESLDAVCRTGGVALDVLMQVNVSGEDSKGGVEPEEVPVMADRWQSLRHLRVMGVMVMAPFDATESALRAVFSGARRAAAQLRAAGHPAPWLSMGMSGDYEVAVEEGATHVRLGTVLFGSRS